MKNQVLSAFNLTVKTKVESAFQSDNREMTAEAGLHKFLKNMAEKGKLIGRNVYHNHMARHHYNQLQKHAEASTRYEDHIKNLTKKGKYGAVLGAKHHLDFHNNMARYHAGENKHHNDAAAKTDNEFAQHDQQHNEKQARETSETKLASQTAVKPAKIKPKTQTDKAKPDNDLKNTKKPKASKLDEVQEHNKAAMKHANAAKGLDKNSPEFAKHKEAALKHNNAAKKKLNSLDKGAKATKAPLKPVANKVKKPVKKIMPTAEPVVPLKPMKSKTPQPPKPIKPAVRKGMAKPKKVL